MNHCRLPDENLERSDVIDEQLIIYDGLLTKFLRDGRVFVERQNAFADALRTMQEESPLVVKGPASFQSAAAVAEHLFSRD